ncbi:MAG: hypothetical protein Q8927_02540 [Bacteroidota bacterium]|nr:hypothetical protein [Bacteroidota bacterium]MDP4215051.1 hypothetical protein [Bacteroidota bacterium]MDP4244282.1 hypothetical protein [Bacteroidota bacterium]MDP4252788.1 hypothetical protein [Bacteroidota bacterium]MDP4257527.1 hypothetical protein [Bacteroidota bacterium]
MRPELENIERIERWLEGSLGAAEKADFDKQMATDPVLREQVMLQQELLLGMERAVLRTKVQAAGVRAARGRNLRSWGSWGSAGLGLLIAAALLFYFYSRHSPKDLSAQSDTEQALHTGARQDGNALPVQIFAIDAGRDTVIETRSGMVLAVPAGSWLDEGGRRIDGKIELLVREALDRASIIESGLTSRNGAQLLESGGMFQVEARQNGKTLSIDSGKGLTAELPTDSIKPGMQLFTGVRQADGSLDWQKPIALTHDLIPVDILSLDFYPPHYLDSVARWGYDAHNKAFTDSLYYSCEYPMTYYYGVESEREASARDMPRADSVVSDVAPYHQVQLHCAIQPARVKAIWSDAFQHTLLATREFGQRMPWIHRTQQQAILDLYVNGLDQRLSTLDSAAAKHLTGKLKRQFMTFAARGEGKVNTTSRQAKILGEYYMKKAKVFAEAIRKTQDEFWSKQAELDNLAATMDADHWRDSVNRLNAKIKEEFVLNLTEACRQLGIDEKIANPPGDGAVYQLNIRATGWYNVDRAVMESVDSRISLDYTDKQTGKRARIAYRPLSVTIGDTANYTRLYVYLLPDKLSSFDQMEKAGGLYQAKLNELIRYDLIIIGYEGEKIFYYAQNEVQPGTYPDIHLAAIAKTALDSLLNRQRNIEGARSVQKELYFLTFQARDQHRRDENRARLELKEKLLEFLYPCLVRFE